MTSASESPPIYKAVPLPQQKDLSDSEARARANAHFEDMKTRHTIREFSDRPVPRDIIETCIATAGRAPSGANHQPWHFVAISDRDIKAQIRAAAEAEETQFYDGAAGDAWLNALEPLGTDASKPHLTTAPWLIVIFAQRYGLDTDGNRYKHYYVPESVGIATGFLITALHLIGLSSLTHTPNPMKFLNTLLNRPEAEKPVMILAVGHPAANATIPQAATLKKPLNEILSLRTEKELSP